MATSTLSPNIVEERSAAHEPGLFDRFFLRLTAGGPQPWNLKSFAGLAALAAIWAAWTYGSWGDWGNLTIDCGRELYVPSVLAQGKTLYRDVWYLYGPLAPYFNSFLYRVFGIHLEVLAWAGSISALGCAVFLYLSGMRLSATLAGWTAGVAVLCQAFHPTLFSFPLPYSYATVYGYLVGCATFYVLIQAAFSGKRLWVFAAATLAAIGLLLKLELGAACYAALALLVGARFYQRRSWKEALKDMAVALPGVVACAAVITWMISLRGTEFITQENLMSWPTSYFMRTLGKAWLEHTGFAITLPALVEAAQQSIILFAFLQGLHLFVSHRRPPRNILILRIALFVLSIAYNLAYLNWFQHLSAIFFPPNVVLYASLAGLGAWWFFLKQPASEKGLAIALAMSFAGLYGFRILLKSMTVEYPIFYNGLAIFGCLFLLRAVIAGIGRSARFALAAELFLCFACLSVPLVRAQYVFSEFPRPVWLKTNRGNIRVSQLRSRTYGAAIQFMKEKNALGHAVLSVPEDTSLYFLSGTICPTRVFAFTPGLVAPGRMTDELIHELETRNVRYLIWSNRTFPEGGGPRFGVDFDQTMGKYLMTHFRRVGPVSPAPIPIGEWTAFIWERIPEGAQP